MGCEDRNDRVDCTVWNGASRMGCGDRNLNPGEFKVLIKGASRMGCVDRNKPNDCKAVKWRSPQGER